MKWKDIIAKRLNFLNCFIFLVNFQSRGCLLFSQQLDYWLAASGQGGNQVLRSSCWTPRSLETWAGLGVEQTGQPLSA